MIRPLRSRHRHMMVVLALVLPALLAAALLARRPVPAQDKLPGSLTPAAVDEGAIAARQMKDAGSGVAVRATFLEDGRLLLELLREAKRPDLLVYWVDERGEIERLPDGARLLGALSTRVPLITKSPPQASVQAGQLLFYSLAQQEIVDRLELRAP